MKRPISSRNHTLEETNLESGLELNESVFVLARCRFHISKLVFENQFRKPIDENGGSLGGRRNTKEENQNLSKNSPL